MKDWSGKEVKREGPTEEKEAAMPLGDAKKPLYGAGKPTEPINVDSPLPDGLAPLKIYQSSLRAEDMQYPVCPDCGRRHPAPGGADSIGAYITMQHVKMNAIRSHEAAEIARREFGENPLIVKVIDAYIGAFVEPDQRDSFVEGLLLGLGTSEEKIVKLEKALARITGLLESFDAMITAKPPKREGKDFGRGW